MLGPVTRKLSATVGFTFAATIALLLSACGSSSTPTSNPMATTSASTGASTGTPVSVTEKEYSISLPKTSFAAGTYTFTVKNEGNLPHNLTISGPGLGNAATPSLSGGQTGTLTVTLQKGSYDLFCSVPGHKDRGMDVMVQVG